MSFVTREVSKVNTYGIPCAPGSLLPTSAHCLAGLAGVAVAPIASAAFCVLLSSLRSTTCLIRPHRGRPSLGVYTLCTSWRQLVPVNQWKIGKDGVACSKAS